METTSTFTFAIRTKDLERFMKHCEKKGVSKSSVIRKIIINYLEFGLRENPSTLRSRTTPKIDKSQNEAIE